VLLGVIVCLIVVWLMIVLSYVAVLLRILLNDRLLRAFIVLSV